MADSTGYLPAELTPPALTVVPLQVIIDNEVFDEGAGTSAADVVSALRRKADVTTSRVTPEQFLYTYRRLAEQGATQIVSIHLSSELSGTYEAAVLAARKAPIEVLCIDTRTVALAMGFATRTACELAAGGADARAVAARVTQRVRASRTWLVVDSLEQLRRGGRIGAASALLGSALLIKPILQVADGQVGVLEKQRTLGRAVARMAELVVAAAPPGRHDLAVQHVAAEGRARELAAQLARSLPQSEVVVAEVGAVISAHVGLGTLSVALCPL